MFKTWNVNRRISWSGALFTIIAFAISTSLNAQTISVSRYNPPTGWSKSISSNGSVNFPTAAAWTPVMTFRIQNTGTVNLLLTGAQPVAKSGPHAAMFTVSQPASTNLAPGAATTFTVAYNPTDSLQHSAILSIPNNSVLNPFLINIGAAGNILFGAKFPPPGSYTYSYVQSGNIGRAGGTVMAFSNVVLSTKTATYWGPSITQAGALEMQCSLDGSSFTGNENFTFSPSESNLAGGIAVWRGNSFINTTSGSVPVYLKCTLTATTTGVIPYPLTNPTTLGLSEEVGALVKFNSVSDVLNANYLISASTNNVTFTPYLDFYDNYPFKTCGSCAYVSFTNGFYWKDLRPVLTVNAGLTLDEGTSAIIGSPEQLNVTDDEDLPAHPERIVFNFKTLPGPDPLNFGTGVINLNGVPLTTANTFTLLDLQNNLLTFTHNGSETTFDQFQFSVKDGNGVLARDGAFSIFNFNITILPVNDPPTTSDTSFTFSYALPITKTLVAQDPDNVSLTFSIVNLPTKGNISSLNPATGQFTYTPTFGSPTTDFFTFQAYDGTVFSNISTVNLNQINLPPVAGNVTVTTMEDIAATGLLPGTDPEGGTPLTFTKIKSPVKGSATVLPNGDYTYSPAPSTFGGDYFTFRVQDPQGNFSGEDTVFIQVIPRLDPGDLLVVDQNKLRLFDPGNSRDTIISMNQGLSQGVNLAFKPGTSVFVFDKVTGLIKINPVTGNQSIVAPRAGFSGGGAIGGAPGMFIDNNGKIILPDGADIVKVDTITGAITTMFSGGSLEYPTGVAYLNNGDLIVSDAGLLAGGSSKIIRITPAGVQTVVSTDPAIIVPLDIAVMDQNTVVLCDAASFVGSTDNIYKVNLANGALTVISAGGSMNIPTGLDFKQSKLYVVNNSGSKNILDVDVVTGVQTIVPGSALSQPWGLMIVPGAVPATKIVQNIVVEPGESFCYNATQIITVAGGGSTFLVKTDGSATMIAGLKILYEPVTQVINGGYLHGYIAPGGPYCYTPSLPAVASGFEDIVPGSSQSAFKIYPNPTSGNITLEQYGDGAFRSGRVEVYSIRGEIILTRDLTGDRKYEFHISGMPSGLYFIKVIASEGIETFKVIKTN